MNTSLRWIFGFAASLSILCLLLYQRISFRFYLRPSLSNKTILVKRNYTEKAVDVKVDIKNNTERESLPVQAKSEKVILVYSKYYGHQWPLIDKLKTSCKHKCRVTTNKSELNESDALLFHAEDIPSVDHLRKLRRKSNQLWIYYTLENPHNTPDVSRFNGFFNRTATYRKESDYFVPYRFLEKLKPDNRTKHQVTANYTKGKTRLIAWTLSHCKSAGKRDAVVQELSKYVPVSIYGGCRSLFPKRDNPTEKNCERSDKKKCSSLYQKFKFYLSFENHHCTDYLTEKYWATPLDNNMVPIVIGPKYYSNIAIPGSYVNLFDFPSIKALADYIKYLDKNETAYNQYFQWKSQYKSIFVPIPSGHVCKICEDLHQDSLYPKVYDNLGGFWGRNTCTANLERLKKYIKF